MKESVRHVNRIKGLLASQGIMGYEPLRQDRREQLSVLLTGEGHPLLTRLRAEPLREIDVIELLMRQIAEIEAERDAVEPEPEHQDASITLLTRLKAIGPQIASVVYLEGLYRKLQQSPRGCRLWGAGADPVA